MGRTKRIQRRLNRLRKRLYLRLVSALDKLRIGPLLRFIFVANILDAALTLTWLEMKVAEEVNPLMAYLIDIDPLIFLLVKILAITLSCLILWQFHQLIPAKIVTIFCVLLYAGILIFHIVGAISAGVLVMPTIPELRNNMLELWERFSAWLSTQILQ